MAIMMIMEWSGVSVEQYDQLRPIVKWETDHPDGAMFHVASHDGNGLRVTDVWQSAEQMQAFIDKRLMPGVMAIGITSQPKVEVYPTHAIFTPGYDPK